MTANTSDEMLALHSGLHDSSDNDFTSSKAEEEHFLLPSEQKAESDGELGESQ